MVYFVFFPLGTWTPFNPETVRLMIGISHVFRVVEFVVIQITM